MTDQPTAPIRIALIGTGRRAAGMYGPILRAMPGVELVSVWGRSEDSARRLGERFAIPAYTDLDRLIRETAPQIGIVCVAYGANGQAGLMAVEHGLNVLVETPIAHELAEADAIIAAAKQRGVKIEVAEQSANRCVTLFQGTDGGRTWVPRLTYDDRLPSQVVIEDLRQMST